MASRGTRRVQHPRWCRYTVLDPKAWYPLVLGKSLLVEVDQKYMLQDIQLFRSWKSGASMMYDG